MRSGQFRSDQPKSNRFSSKPPSLESPLDRQISCARRISTPSVRVPQLSSPDTALSSTSRPHRVVAFPAPQTWLSRPSHLFARRDAGAVEGRVGDVSATPYLFPPCPFGHDRWNERAFQGGRVFRPVDSGSSALFWLCCAAIGGCALIEWLCWRTRNGRAMCGLGRVLYSTGCKGLHGAARRKLLRCRGSEA